MQSSMQHNQGSKYHFKHFKNISQLKKKKFIIIIMHINPKNTHTLNKSNQFYISKTS